MESLSERLAKAEQKLEACEERLANVQTEFEFKVATKLLESAQKSVDGCREAIAQFSKEKAQVIAQMEGRLPREVVMPYFYNLQRQQQGNRMIQSALEYEVLSSPIPTRVHDSTIISVSGKPTTPSLEDQSSSAKVGPQKERPNYSHVKSTSTNMVETIVDAEKLKTSSVGITTGNTSPKNNGSVGTEKLRKTNAFIVESTARIVNDSVPSDVKPVSENAIPSLPKYSTGFNDSPNDKSIFMAINQSNSSSSSLGMGKQSPFPIAKKASFNFLDNTSASNTRELVGSRKASHQPSLRNDMGMKSSSKSTTNLDIAKPHSDSKNLPEMPMGRFTSSAYISSPILNSFKSQTAAAQKAAGNRTNQPNSDNMKSRAEVGKKRINKNSKAANRRKTTSGGQETRSPVPSSSLTKHVEPGNDCVSSQIPPPPYESKPVHQITQDRKMRKFTESSTGSGPVIDKFVREGDRSKSSSSSSSEITSPDISIVDMDNFNERSKSGDVPSALHKNGSFNLTPKQQEEENPAVEKKGELNVTRFDEDTPSTPNTRPSSISKREESLNIGNAHNQSSLMSHLDETPARNVTPKNNLAVKFPHFQRSSSITRQEIIPVISTPILPANNSPKLVGPLNDATEAAFKSPSPQPSSTPKDTSKSLRLADLIAHRSSKGNVAQNPVTIVEEVIEDEDEVNEHVDKKLKDLVSTRLANQDVYKGNQDTIIVEEIVSSGDDDYDHDSNVVSHPAGSSEISDAPSRSGDNLQEVPRTSRQANRLAGKRLSELENSNSGPTDLREFFMEISPGRDNRQLENGFARKKRIYDEVETESEHKKTRYSDGPQSQKVGTMSDYPIYMTEYQ